MAIQILPIIKAVAPYLAQVATAAIPAFTSKPAESAKSLPVMAKQISELQKAATQNAESIHVLAEKLQQVVHGLEVAAEEGRKEVAAYKTMVIAALGLAGLSLLLSFGLLVR